jgi:translation initiation factor 3 subunit E
LDPHLVLAVLNKCVRRTIPHYHTPLSLPTPTPTPYPPPLPPHSTPQTSFVRDLQIYDEKSLISSLLAISRRTKLAHFSVDLYKELHKSSSGELESAKETVLQDLQSQVAACGPLVTIVGVDEEPPLLVELRESGNFHVGHLREEYGVTEEHVHSLFVAAKGRYDAGEYRGALAYLALYEELRHPKRDDVPLEVSWGKMAAAMMDDDALEKADEERMAIADALRRRPATVLSDLQRLQQRAWLLHWSLFILASHHKRKDALLEFYMAEENLSCVAITCPWLLRYLIAAIIPRGGRKHAMAKALVRLLTPDVLAQRDPFVVFLHALLVKFDFEAAQLVIADCCDAIATDFFLSNMVSPDLFVTSARGFLFDVYCRVHQRINLRTLAKEVHMEEEEAEKWVVGLIRSATLDAKVDSEAKIVEMIIPSSSL